MLLVACFSLLVWGSSPSTPGPPTRNQQLGFPEEDKKYLTDKEKLI
jgi:hypothetical protein